jgi:hypothetical protein
VSTIQESLEISCYSLLDQIPELERCGVCISDVGFCELRVSSEGQHLVPYALNSSPDISDRVQALHNKRITMPRLIILEQIL